MRILMAEHDPLYAEQLQSKLEEYEFTVDNCTEQSNTVAHLLLGTYQAALLDLSMPGLDIFELLGQLQVNHCSTPILCLSDTTDLEFKLNVLYAGASEYMTRPIGLNEICARTIAIIRTANGIRSEVLQEADLMLDERSRNVTRSGRMIDLTRREYALLECLMLNRGQIVTKEEILSTVWGPDYEGDNDIVEVYISYLRRKIDCGFNVPLVHTVRGLGYTLRAPADVNENVKA